MIRVRPQFSRVVDLSQQLGPRIPIWPGDPRPRIKPIAMLEHDGYQQNLLTLAEHTGTHLGAPAHFLRGGRTIDRIRTDELIAPAAVISIAEKASQDPDCELTLPELEAWEMEHGRLLPGWFVLLHTGWACFWDDERRYRNQDDQGVMHFPGFGRAAAEFLVRERGVIGLGSDALGVDRGCDSELPVSRLLAQTDKLHLENLTNLDKLPPRGAWLFIGALRITGGMGSPARVLALIP